MQRSEQNKPRYYCSLIQIWQFPSVMDIANLTKKVQLSEKDDAVCIDIELY